MRGTFQMIILKIATACILTAALATLLPSGLGYEAALVVIAII